jgi:DNA-binding MarR family transcriptional regulator
VKVRPKGPSIGADTMVLPQRPGLSNSELARGAFVSRQSMNVLLQSMEREGLLTRPATAPVGKALPARLTPLGRRNLANATVAVRTVEERMLTGLDVGSRTEARRILTSLITSLESAGRP